MKSPYWAKIEIARVEVTVVVVFALSTEPLSRYSILLPLLSAFKANTIFAFWKMFTIAIAFVLPVFAAIEKVPKV